MLCHIFSNTLKQKAQWMLPLCPGKFATVIRTHTHSRSHYQKSTPGVSVTPGFCFLHGLWWQWGFPFSGTHVERWYVWILNRTPQRIPNWEHGVVLGASFIFTFILPRSVFGTDQLENSKATLILSQRKTTLTAMQDASQLLIGQNVWVVMFCFGKSSFHCK